MSLRWLRRFARIRFLSNRWLGFTRQLQLKLQLERLEDRTVPSIFTVTNTGDNGGVNPNPGDGTGTLRQAIIDANANSGADDIVFNIAGGGLNTIRLASALPTITDAVTIDGTTEPGYTGTPIIELISAEVKMSPWKIPL